MTYAFKTAGEQLAHFIEQTVLKDISWDRVANSLLYTGRNEVLCDFFREVAVINLTCRVIVAGTSLLKESVDRPSRSPDDVSFEMEFREFIRERLNVGPSLLGNLFRNAKRAVESAQHNVSTTERSRFKRWAQREHPRCYMCGTALDFTEQDPGLKFSLEHIWPQRYGGDSIEDNWLPACGYCNSVKKRDFATWAMPDVQSVVLGFAPSNSEFSMVSGSHKFALHNLAAKKLAIRRNISLKDAFLKLGPWEDTLRLTDEDDLGDFFNLAIHRSTVEVN